MCVFFSDWTPETTDEMFRYPTLTPEAENTISWLRQVQPGPQMTGEINDRVFTR